MKKNVKIIAVSAVVLLLIAIAVFIPIKKYIDECPVIISDDVVDVDIGTTISIDEIAEFENAVEFKILNNIIETNGETNAKVSADGQSLFAGYYDTDFDIIIQAIGENHEVREKQITIRVLLLINIKTSLRKISGSICYFLTAIKNLIFLPSSENILSCSVTRLY